MSMTSVSLISAVLVAVITSIATVLSSKSSNDRTQAVLDERLNNYHQSVTAQVEELSSRVEKHNGLIERMVIQEMNTEAQWKRIDELHEDVELLKKKG